jgi:hypothetical protein
MALFASDRNGALLPAGGSLGFLFAALVTGMLVGGMAVARLRARDLPPER